MLLRPSSLWNKLFKSHFLFVWAHIVLYKSLKQPLIFYIYLQRIQTFRKFLKVVLTNNYPDFQKVFKSVFLCESLFNNFNQFIPCAWPLSEGAILKEQKQGEKLIHKNIL